MNLQQLEYFVASVEHGSFSAAADALHLAQPSVSEQVRRLEDELGVRLFQRVGRGLVLTDAGRTLRPRAEAVRESVQEARESVAAVRELRGGTASFGTFAAAGDYLGSDLIAEFRRRHPNVRVRILGLNSADAAEDVRAGRLEAAIVALPIDDDGLDVRPVVEDELVFVSADPRQAAPADDDRAARRDAADHAGRELRHRGPDAPAPGRARAARRRHDPPDRRRRVRRDRAWTSSPRASGDTVNWRGLLVARRHRLAESGSAGCRSPSRSTSRWRSSSATARRCRRRRA